MCGIIGYLLRGESNRSVADHDTAVASIAHRGPDGCGVFAEPGVFLGHARLAILDLGPLGSQPMASADGSLVVSFNGEIYNFRELRAELESRGRAFRSGSDTEVLVEGWQEWGAALLDRLRGIFAFALYERGARTLHLARDHFGVKPLFYAEAGDGLFFASEPLALARMLPASPSPDPQDLDAYFTFNYLPAPRTGLAGLRQLEPGTHLASGPQGVSRRAFWRLELDPDPAPPGPSRVEEFVHLLDRAVSAQLVSDAPLGLFLSGGLDSYAVASSAAKTRGGLAAFTLGFGHAAYDETLAAQESADRLGLALHPVRYAWDEGAMRAALGNMRDLLADASCIPMDQLCGFARRHVSVTLAGDGGDELLAGYDTYATAWPMSLLRLLPVSLRVVLLRVAAHLPSDTRRYGMRMVAERLLRAAAEGPGRDHASLRRIFHPALKARLYHPDFRQEVRDADPVGEYAALLREAPASRSWLAARQFADVRFHLPSILAKVDRTSMAHGLEVRVPFLDLDLVSFCLNLPDAAKRSGGKGKAVLRECVNRTGPPGLLRRPKAGFLPPVEAMFRTGGPLVPLFDEALAWAEGNLGWLVWTEVRRAWAEHRRGRCDLGFAFLGILQFVNWNRQLRHA